MTDISVIIPAYNHAAFIAEAIRSVLDQQGVELELILVDDGSTDRTMEVVGRIHDPRLKVVQQVNQGAHAAINRGLELAASDTLAILNSDDRYTAGRLGRGQEVLRNHPEVGLVGTYIQVIDEAGKPAGIKHGYKDLEPWLLPDGNRTFRDGEDTLLPLLTENYFATTSNYLFRKSLVQQIGYFRPLRFTHDWDFALRALHGTDLYLIPEPLVDYRVHGANTIRKDKPEMIFEVCWVLAVHLPQLLKLEKIQSRLVGKFDELVHSIYTFGMDRVLSSLLMLDIARDAEIALELLNPQNKERQVLIQYISSQLQQAPQPGGIRSTRGWQFMRQIKRMLVKR